MSDPGEELNVEQRTLCADGTCIGVLDTEGVCPECGRQEERTSDVEFAQRKLCGDGSCIGVIGPNGRCKECGAVFADAVRDPRLQGLIVPIDPPTGDSSLGEADFASRQLCPDGSCIGVLDDRGVCLDCGAVSEEQAVAD